MKAIFNFKILSLLVLTSFFFASCEKDDTPETDAFEYSEEDTARAAKTDNIVEGTFNIMENAFVENEERGNFQNSFFPECTIITIIINGDSGTIILDFGESCQLNNGSVVSGIIRLEYGPVIGGTRTIDYSFEDYFYNLNGVSGGGQIFREIANANGNPQSTVNESITVSFPNTSVTATRTGLRVSEWVEGIGGGTWMDNVYHITGNWETIFTNGFERSGEVTETLVLELACPFLVAGRLEIAQEGTTGIIDFGDGECDNIAILIVNGQEYTIIMQ